MLPHCCQDSFTITRILVKAQRSLQKNTPCIAFPRELPTFPQSHCIGTHMPQSRSFSSKSAEAISGDLARVVLDWVEPREVLRKRFLCLKTFFCSASYVSQGSGWVSRLRPHLFRPLMQSKHKPSQRSFSLSDRRVMLRDVNIVLCEHLDLHLRPQRAKVAEMMGISRDDSASSCSCSGFDLPPAGQIGQSPLERMATMRSCTRSISSDSCEAISKRSSRLVMHCTSSLRTASC